MNPIPFMRPVLDDLEAEEVRRVILSGWVTQGPEVEKFESDFAAFVDQTNAAKSGSNRCAATIEKLARDRLAQSGELNPKAMVWSSITRASAI